MAKKGQTEGETPETGRPPVSLSPDTEFSPPPTPIPSTQSIDVELASTESDSASRAQPTLDSRENEQKTQIEASPKTGKSKFSPSSERVTAAQVKAGSSRENSSTTLQSMKRPEISARGVPHTRRFLSIERELEQCGASIKLLEKEQIRLRRETRIAWSVATLALLLAFGALYL